MPNTETYNYYTTVTGTVGGTLTTQGSAFSGAAEDYLLSDLDDGTIDGQTALGAAIQIGTETSPDQGTGIFRGFTQFGDPIIEVMGVLRFYGPSPYATNQPVNSSTTGPFAYCFAKGTLIAIPSCEQPVETLQIGDLVRTSDGREVPVKWVGRQTINKLFAGVRAQLVRINAGTLGNHTDLYVTGDHGMILDDYIFNASALVNNRSISWVPLRETPAHQTVYHVETDHHDVILANGAASETYLDTPGRHAFDNYHEFLDPYGISPPIPESPMLRVASARVLPDAVKTSLAA